MTGGWLRIGQLRAVQEVAARGAHLHRRPEICVLACVHLAGWRRLTQLEDVKVPTPKEVLDKQVRHYGAYAGSGESSPAMLK
jgi:hypothetical protein